MFPEQFGDILNALFLCTLIGALVFGWKNYPSSAEKYFFIINSACLIALTFFRPFGVSRDDFNYEIHANNICSFIDCGFKQDFIYDSGYLFLLSIAKIVLADSSALLLIATISLTFKLILIARITSYSMISLFLYLSIFYLYHDVTQFRVSAASSFYLLTLILLSYKKNFYSFMSFIASVTMHFQAIFAFILPYFKLKFQGRYWLALVAILIFQIFSALELNISTFILPMLNLQPNRVELSLIQDVNTYGIKGTNILITILLAFCIPPLVKIKNVENNLIFAYCFLSIFVGFMYYWIFSGIPVFPDRILQFFLVPIVILVSLGRKNLITYLFTLITGILFFLLNSQIDPILNY